VSDWVVWIAGGLAVAYAVHQLLLWFERRGWLYYVNSKRSGRVSLAAFSALDPAARQIQQTQEQEVSEEAEPGDPPQV
jgi:hypothetical protein